MYVMYVRGDYNLKKVAILLRLLRKDNESSIDTFGIKSDVINAIKNYNVNYYLIPMNTALNDDYNNIIEMLKMADGVIIPGGRRGASNMEFDIIKWLYDNDIPTLGICFGHANMGRLFGGKKKPVEGHWVLDKKYVHYINIKKDSLLYEIIGKERIMVNSRHKNIVVDTKMDVSAYNDENMPEAFEDKTKRCFIGVQWHPESIMDCDNKKIFDYFISKL